MAKEQKPLTERQAKNCEEAREPACHCRCGGQFHGGKRGGANAPMSFYYSLPENDPHFTPSPEEKARRKQEKLEAKRKERDAKRTEADKIANDLRDKLAIAQRDGQYDLAHELSRRFLEAHRNREEVYKATR